MERIKLSEISQCCKGTLIGGEDIFVNSVCIDTRKLEKGCLFICIKGENFDAHSFAEKASELGAAAVMAEKEVECSCPVIRVNSTKQALLDFAEYYRGRFNIPIVGLTGSVGKTTTKEFIALVLASRYNTIKTQGNLNNDIGLPQMIFQINSKTEAAVIEMGMNHFNEISALTKVTKPDIGVITNIGVSHIENLGSREGILKAKLEILEGMKKDAPLVLNGDNDLLKTVKIAGREIVFFSVKNKNARFRAINIAEKSGKTEFTVSFDGKEQRIIIPAIGIHNVYNALCAFAVGILLGVEQDSAAQALTEYVPSGMRQKCVCKGGITSIEDCYNASPDSMKAALSALDCVDAEKRIAVLGDMLELGSYSGEAHFNVGKLVADSKADYLFAYGENAEKYVEGAKSLNMKSAYHFDDKEELVKMLVETAKPGDAVVFKASRGMRLEEVISSAYKEWEK